MFVNGTQTELIKELGYSRTTIYRKMKQFAPEVSFPVNEEDFNNLVYAIKNGVMFSEVSGHKNNNIERRREEIKRDMGLVAGEREAISSFIEDFGTDISEEAKEKIISNLKEDYRFYSGLIRTYKFLVNESLKKVDKNGKPIKDLESEKNLADAQRNLHAIIKQLKELDVFKAEKKKVESFSFAPKPLGD